MAERNEQATATANRHIIERPRLTRLLDETTARVIMLVAPAGYGKTTLAREWLRRRPQAWYGAGSASSDIAALGAGLVSAATEVNPSVGHSFQEWVRARRGPGDTSRAADLIVQDLVDWPDGAWLAIDDYQWLTPEMESVIDRLRACPNMSLLITSRRRPCWSTNREFLYGEIYELGAPVLAMTESEAGEVLDGLEDDLAIELTALAAGWPAVIGLASFVPASSLVDRNDLPPTLHAYIADELFTSVHQDVREDLAQIGLLTCPNDRLVDALLGPRGRGALDEGLRVGFLTRDPSGDLTMHPLLRGFLRKKLFDVPSRRRSTLLREAACVLLEHDLWDDAFEVIREFELMTLVDLLLETCTYDLLEHGLLTTLSRFVEYGRSAGSDSPLLDLADAELAFREGFHERSEGLASRAGNDLSARPHLAAKAFCRAGHSAYFMDSSDEATRYFERSRQLAEHVDDERSAVWGLFLSALEKEDDCAVDLLAEFEALATTAVDDVLRVQNGRLHFGMRLGALDRGLFGSEAVANISDKARDPVARVSFWHIYSGALRVRAEYDASLEASDRALREIATFDLDFARAHVYLTRAGVYLGLSAYEEAERLLDEVARIGGRTGDTYVQMNERTNRCRLHLLIDDADTALSVTDVEWPHVASSGQFGEFLACRALANARVTGEHDQSLSLLAQAEGASRENESSSLCGCVKALLSLDSKELQATEQTISAFHKGLSKGIIDPYVFAFRLDKRLPRLISRAPHLRSAIRELLPLLDATASATLQLPTQLSPATLTEALSEREMEVLALIVGGNTNKEIGALLFLTESTVKAHVRNILRKLGVRTRTELAILALRTQQREGGGLVDLESALEPPDPPI